MVEAAAPVLTVPYLKLRFTDLQGAPEISLSQALLEEAIEDDEKITRPHFLDLKLGHALFAVDPTIRHDRISVAAHDRLQWQLDGQIEVLREQRLDPGDHRPAVHLKGIRDVVAGNAKQQPNEPVPKTVQDQFRAGIVHHSTTAAEPRAEDAIVTFLQFAIERNEVGR